MLKDIILKNGYVKKGHFGYYKEINVGEDDDDDECIISHWITVLGYKDCEADLQMFSYYKEEPDGEKIYDTGNVNVNESQLQVLIDVLTK